MTAPFPTKGGPDWTQVFANFHARHRDGKGKKLVFTAVFNASMDAFIMCPEVPLVWRALAWIWRHSWGNDSDYCVDGIGGNPLGQQACANHFGVDKRRVHDCVTLLRQLNFVLPPDGHKLYPIDDPTKPPQKAPNTTDVESPAPSGLFEAYCDEWKVRHLTDFQELESAEATVNRIKKDRLGGYRPWVRARSNHGQSIGVTLKPVVESDSPSEQASPTKTEREPAGGRAFLAVANDSRTEEPPARPTILSVSKQPAADPPWYATLRALLADKQVFRCGVPLDEPMFRRIASHLTEELLPQFKTESEKANNIRKWAGYESIAKQVVACGLVPAAAPGPMKPPQSAKKGFVDSVMEEAQRRLAKYGRI